MRMSSIDDLYVLCMYAGLFSESDVQEFSTEELTRQLSVPKEYVQKFGAYAVVIVNPGEFVERITSFAKDNNYSIWRRAVQYVGSHAYEETALSIDRRVGPAFIKPPDYAEEKEYRFAIETNTSGNNPITINIGPLDDIAFKIKTTEINKSLRIHE